ncbi:MAG: DUF2470 domain-containing protein [Limnothrix sp. RL_2_0]|nr:DUF2470 domain-containing protein [Limnothrix sp. RL_2_0]
MSDIITPAISDRICKHMNKDHAEAVLTYAKYFGKQDNAEAAEMLALDETGMDLEVAIAATKQPLRIPFPKTLENPKEAHTVLVDMMKEAQGEQSDTAS